MRVRARAREIARAKVRVRARARARARTRARARARARAREKEKERKREREREKMRAIIFPNRLGQKVKSANSTGKSGIVWIVNYILSRYIQNRPGKQRRLENLHESIKCSIYICI